MTNNIRFTAGSFHFIERPELFPGGFQLCLDFFHRGPDELHDDFFGRETFFKGLGTEGLNTLKTVLRGGYSLSFVNDSVITTVRNNVNTSRH